ncbi:hypothetical protein GCM10027568_33470 [Humibacter soli]
MLAALVPMVAGQISAAVASGLLLVALAMILAPFCRSSSRVRIHVVDLLAMGIVTVAAFVAPVGHTGMAMPMSGVGGLQLAWLIAAGWAAARVVLTIRQSGHRRWSVATGVLTAACLAAMLLL